MSGNDKKKNCVLLMSPLHQWLLVQWLLQVYYLGLFTVAIFRPFSAHFHVFGRGTNKREWKREWKMMWKIVTANTLGSEIKKNGAKMHFSHQAHCQKGEKWNENEMENDGKMSWKWAKNGYHEP